MSESTSNPTLAPSAEPVAAPSRAGVSFVTALILAVACGAASGYIALRLATKSTQTTPVALIDSERIMKAQLESVLSNPNLKPDEASAAARTFSEGLNRELARYSEAGIVVISSSVVVNRPEGLDVTTDVARALGVQLK